MDDSRSPDSTLLEDTATAASAPLAASDVSDMPACLQAEQLNDSARLVLMLVNRSAGASSRKLVVDEASAALTEAGFEVKQISSLDELAQLTGSLSSDTLRCVVAVGGDGTLGAMLNNTPEGTPLTILPAGTENLMARYLRLSNRAEELVQLVRQGLSVRLDTGIANGRLFSLLASAGFDADVVRRVHARRVASGGGNISKLAYAQPIFEAISSYRYAKLRVTGKTSDGESIKPINGCWLFGVNLPGYASGLRIAPGASGLDGLLDLCVYKRRQMMAGLWFLWHIIRNRHYQLPSVETVRVVSCRIESTDGEEIPYQIDGDPGGTLPLELSIAPRRLRVLVTPATAQLISTSTA